MWFDKGIHTKSGKNAKPTQLWSLSNTQLNLTCRVKSKTAEAIN